MAGALIGALRVSLSAETSAFEAGMRRSQKTAQTTANSITSSFKQAGGAMNVLKAGVSGFIASLSVGTFVAAGKAALDYAASLGETAAQLGVTTRELQNFRAVAAQNGASVAEADTALGKLSLNLSKAESGSKTAAAAFESVGVNIRDITTKSRWEIIGQIADKMNEQGGAARNAAAGQAIFGRGFQKLIPTLDQGSAGINDLADANERLGGVLSDEQIQNADKTADKIEQLYNVLRARIAADVAENSGAIAEFANFLFQLADAATKARDAINDFVRNYSIPSLVGKVKGDFFAQGYNTPGRAVSVKLPPSAARPKVPQIVGGPPKFLAGGGGGGGGRAKRDRSAEDALRKQIDALRDANQFDQDIRRASIDILNAKRDLATDAVERYQISVDTKDAEDAAFAAQLAYEVKLNELTKGQDGINAAQAQELQLKHDQLSQLERDKLKAEEAQRAFEESARLDDLQFDLERDRLRSEEQLAETASEQRDVQLKLLDLAYRQERARLQTILADEQSSDAAKEEARRRLANLDKTYGNDKQSVMNNTRGPLEEYTASLPTTADKWNEELERVEVDGLKSLEDGLVDIAMGTKTVGEAFHDMANQIIADLIRIAVRRFVIGTIVGLFSGGGEVGGGGAVGMASGGFVSGPGGPTADRVPAMLSAGEYVINARATRRFLPLLERINDDGATRLAMGGLALPRTNFGSRARLSNDNEAMGRGGPYFDLRGAVMTEDLLRQMNEIGVRAADAGGNLGVKRMRDLNERTFGRGR